MISFAEEYMSNTADYDDEGYDEQKILINSISSVLPKIIENELTQKQKICFELFYIRHKTQTEIASMLKLSQPTVSRHIKSAAKIVNKIGNYCFYSVKKANSQWLELN